MCKSTIGDEADYAELRHEVLRQVGQRLRLPSSRLLHMRQRDAAIDHKTVAVIRMTLSEAQVKVKGRRVTV